MKTPADSVQRRTALITGASSGIGFELAKLFARDRYSVVLVARNHEALARIADELVAKYGVSVKCIASDLSVPSFPEQLYKELRRQDITVNVLVNSAGFGVFGQFSDTDLSSELNMIQVNIVALTHLTKLFLNDMIKRKEGKILNLASTAAFQPGPLMAIYHATKAYVLTFSEAIAEETRGKGVTVTALCPGPTRTGFQKRAKIRQIGLFAKGRVLNAETVARVGYEALMNGKTVVIPGLRNMLLTLAVRSAPRGWVSKTTRYLRERNASEPVTV